MAVRAHRMSLHPRSGGSPAEKLDKLIAFAKGHRRALVLTHDNPDPDSLASGVALAWLLGELAGVEATGGLRRHRGARREPRPHPAS